MLNINTEEGLVVFRPMLTSDFSFDLPDEQIAQVPLEYRHSSRLLHLNSEGQIQDKVFHDLLEQLQAGDLLVLNNTRVIPARLYGHKDTGGRVEMLIERILDDHSALVHVKASKAPKPGSSISLDGGESIVVVGRKDALFVLRSEDENWFSLLGRAGHIPLPPYIKRQDGLEDRERYQTVFAKEPGAVAAPTAGLHFDREFLKEIEAKGIEVAYVTLHVGAGTFQPVRVDNPLDHVMHEERVIVPEDVCDAVARCRQSGGRVVAVGTTAVRSLETAAEGGELRPYDGMSRLFITPGFEFRVVDALLTNFHLSESTLLMLVCAFSSYEAVMPAYRHAVSAGYRFFSYGDAMFLERITHEV